MKVIKNPDKAIVDIISQKLIENDGYCPCKIKKTQETKCMCKEFRDFIKNGGEGECHCGLYVVTR